jgi:hypothetical protein
MDRDEPQTIEIYKIMDNTDDREELIGNYRNKKIFQSLATRKKLRAFEVEIV